MGLLPAPAILDVPGPAWLGSYPGPGRGVSLYSVEVPLSYLRLKDFPTNAIHGQVFS